MGEAGWGSSRHICFLNLLQHILACHIWGYENWDQFERRAKDERRDSKGGGGSDDFRPLYMECTPPPFVKHFPKILPLRGALRGFGGSWVRSTRHGCFPNLFQHIPACQPAVGFVIDAPLQTSKTGEQGQRFNVKDRILLYIPWVNCNWESSSRDGGCDGSRYCR